MDTYLPKDSMYAIYLEFQSTDPADSFYQGLFIPSGVVGSYRSAPAYAYKQVSYSRPRRVWEVKQNTRWIREQTINPSLEAALEVGSNQLGALTAYLRPFISDPLWKSAGSFPIEVTTSDLLALKETPTRLPASLSARIKSARELANFRPLPEVS